MDPKYKNFKFIDDDFFNYQSKEKSVIIKEAELSDPAKKIYSEILEILFRSFERKLKEIDANIMVDDPKNTNEELDLRKMQIKDVKSNLMIFFGRVLELGKFKIK